MELIGYTMIFGYYAGLMFLTLFFYAIIYDIFTD